MTEALSAEVVELDASGPDGLAEEWRPPGRPFTTMGDGDIPLQQQFLNIPAAEGEAVIQPHRGADDGERKPVARELTGVRHRITTCYHPVLLS